MDHLLVAFIEANEQAEIDRCLAHLIDEHARPIVREILGSTLQLHVDKSGVGRSSQDAGDLLNDILVSLISRLRHLRHDPEQHAIADFRSYVASTAYNACNLHLRRKFPRRSRLKNRLRYLLSHDNDFALWISEASGLLCGFAIWRGKNAHVPGRFLEKIRQDPGEWTQTVGLTSVSIDRADLTGLLKILFRESAGPLKLDDLVNVVAEICHEKDQPDEQLETATTPAAPACSLETILEQQHTLAIFWNEVCSLPPRQRIALLLNFRDSRGQELLSLMPHTRTATIEQIATALDFPLADFLKLWNDLPLDDMAIARLLGATRQQVINLRKCARERLERRMNAVFARSSRRKVISGAS
jgi:RNA polymerase sigma factor (sigma-70 family)